MDALTGFNIVDIIAVVFIAFSVFQGLRRGLSGELARVIGAVLALWAGWRFYGPLGETIYHATRLGEQGSQALAFFIGLAAVFFLIFILRLVLRQIMEFTFKGKIERIGGALAGLLRSAAVVAAVVLLVGLLPNDYLRTQFVEESFIGRSLQSVVPVVREKIEERYPNLRAAGEEDEGLGPVEE